MNLPRPRTVRAKILANSALILLLMAGATLYSGFASLELARSVELLFRNNLALEQIQTALDQTEAAFSDYLRTKDSDALKEHIKNTSRLSDLARGMDTEIQWDDISMLQRDLSRALTTYLRTSELGVQAKRGRDVAAYAEYFDAAGRHAAAARTLLAELKGRFLAQSLQAFSLYQSLIPGVLLSNAALVLAAALLGFTLLLRYSRNLTQPLSRLAESALAVGRGDYDTPIPALGGGDEIGTVARAFGQMRDSVRQSFEDLRTRGEVERSLLEERMRVLELDHRLKDAELLALQTQINPHFLFNTLSAGLGLAGDEGAERTSAFLENLAVFIRYALNPPDRFVTVADEIECVNRYIYLLRLRFGGRFGFDVRVDPAVLKAEVPVLVLQPLVENAVTHGLADRESGGLVTVRGWAEGAGAVLSVKDNGAGLEAGEAERLRTEALAPDAGGDHGIGLRNVIRRIQLSTDGRGGVELGGGPGEGLEVRLRLPGSGEGGTS